MIMKFISHLDDLKRAQWMYGEEGWKRYDGTEASVSGVSSGNLSVEGRFLTIFVSKTTILYMHLAPNSAPGSLKRDRDPKSRFE
jgi:hypothetical protein